YSAQTMSPSGPGLPDGISGYGTAGSPACRIFQIHSATVFPPSHTGQCRSAVHLYIQCRLSSATEPGFHIGSDLLPQPKVSSPLRTRCHPPDGSAGFAEAC